MRTSTSTTLGSGERASYLWRTRLAPRSMHRASIGRLFTKLRVDGFQRSGTWCARGPVSMRSGSVGDVSSSARRTSHVAIVRVARSTWHVLRGPMKTARRTAVSMLVAFLACGIASVEAATIYVGEGDSLQDALDAAQPGDTILLQQGAEFVGTFVLPAKGGDAWIVIRTSAPDTVLPPDGVRIHPAHAPL